MPVFMNFPSNLNQFFRSYLNIVSEMCFSELVFHCCLGYILEYYVVDESFEVGFGFNVFRENWM